MPRTKRQALSAYRRRLKRRGVMRLRGPRQAHQAEQAQGQKQQATQRDAGAYRMLSKLTVTMHLVA
jgi:hypothetical protein